MQLFSFSGGPWMDWNLVPWQPSPPLRLPPLQAWCPSLCDPGQSGDTNTVELLIVFSLRHLCFSPAVILAPCLCVLCVTVSAVSSLAHTKMAPHLLLTHLSPLICEMKCVHQILQEGKYYAKLKCGLTVKFSWHVLHKSLLLPAITSIQATFRCTHVAETMNGE